MGRINPISNDDGRTRVTRIEPVKRNGGWMPAGEDHLMKVIKNYW
jgi:hypothetical protein